MTNRTQPTANSNLGLTKIRRREHNGGVWVEGKIDGHRYQALVFSEHADDPSFELVQSKISKLWVQRLADHKVVFNWDRGLDIASATPAAQAIVDLLAANLACEVEQLKAAAQVGHRPFTAAFFSL